jgi:outer membrane protein OmpA-like peptidoglycan-associated protein
LLEFEGWITKDAKPGELTTRSVAMFNAPSQNNQRTPVALTSALLAIVPANKKAHKPEEAPKFGSFNPDLSDADKAALIPVLNTLKGLENLQLEVAGHTDNMPIARRSRHIFKDNTALSLARARSAANYLAEQLGLNPDQVTIAGHGSRKPLQRNNSSEARAKNRRVEVNILAGNNGMSIAQADSGNQLVTTMGVAPGGFDFPVAATASGPVRNMVTMPVFDKAFLAQTDSKFEWLWPSEGYLPNIPSTKVAVKHANGQRIQLKLNGASVSELNFSGREKYTPNKSAISMWSGVDLKEGNNVFEASLLDKEGNVIDRKQFELHYSGTPTKVKLVEDETKAVADGVIAPVIAVQLFDKDGYTVRDGLQGEFTVDGPYYALDPNKNQAQINRNDFKPNYEITAEGIAYITLEPTTQAGEAVIRFPLANGQEEEIRVWLKPQNREWMLIALGEGTIGYQNISGHVENAKSHDQNDGLYTDGRLALFAKGQILGDWLLTAAYDSAKGETSPFEKLLDPNQYYTLYGDNSQQNLDASMEGKLYLRVERDRFYTVFGDYNTDLNNTELSKYLRKFHGIQSVFKGDIVSFNAFVTESAQRFARDEIRGDGTSGLYQLSNQDILIQSETISIQVRDRFRSELILSEVELSKDTDYSIDYIDGSLFFKAPIQSTDEDLNPRYIIARYETEDDSANDLTYGGRAAVHVLDNRLEIGTTLISEELGTEAKTLNSIDLRLKLSDALEIKAEAASTDNTDNGVNTQASANYISLDYRGEQLQTKAYIQTQQAGFGLDQLNDSEGSTEKASVEATYYFTSQKYVNALLTDQNTLGSQQRLTMAEVKLNNEYELGRYHLGVRTQDTSSAIGDTQSIQQLLAGHSYTLLNGKVLLNADAEINVKQTEDVYDLLRLSTDYRITDTVTLFGIFETGFEKDAPQRTALGLRAKPWQGMQVSNSVEEQQSKDGARLFAVHGLNQEINLDENWQISFGYDQASDLQNSINDQALLTSTSEDFYAVTTGWGYRSTTWQWTNRIEYRESDLNRKWNGTTGLYRPIALGLAMGINGEYRLDDSQDSKTEFKQVEFNIGLRPLELGLAWLNQTKYIEEDQTNTSGTITSTRLVNNTHLNMRWHDTQISVQYGLKYVDETIDDIDYSGVIDLIGTQLRHHITQKWDWGLQAQRLYDYELQSSRHSFGASIGFIPAENTWVSFGYNFAGFDDSDFDEAGYSGHGIYLKIRVKADQNSLGSLKSYFK